MFAWSLVLCSELSKRNQSKSILKVMALVMPWLRAIFHLKPQPIAISVLLCKLRSEILKPSQILHVCIGIQVNHVKFERHAWPYPPCINCLLIYKMPYPSYRFDDAKLLEPGNPVSYILTM